MGDRVVFVEEGTSWIPEMPEEVISEASEALGAEPRFRACIMFQQEEAEYRTARRIASASARRWGAVWYKHTGLAERLKGNRRDVPPAASRWLWWRCGVYEKQARRKRSPASDSRTPPAW